MDAKLASQFARRKSGLLKKSYELSVLCKAEICVLIRDKTTGKLYIFTSNEDGIIPYYQCQTRSFLQSNAINGAVEYKTLSDVREAVAARQRRPIRKRARRNPSHAPEKPQVRLRLQVPTRI